MIVGVGLTKGGGGGWKLVNGFLVKRLVVSPCDCEKPQGSSGNMVAIF